jgi:hypothetical protein
VNERPSRPPAFVASCIFGAIGLVLLVIGFATGSEPVLISAGAGGALSLGSALVWRSQLVDAWHGERRGPQSPSNGAS